MLKFKIASAGYSTDRSAERTHWLHISEWSLDRYLRWRAYHWLHMAVWRVAGLRSFLRWWVGADRFQQIIVAQDLKCAELGGPDRFVISVHITEEQAVQMKRPSP